MNSTPRPCSGRLNNKRLQLINHLTTCSTGFASTFPALLARSSRRNEGCRAMEPYWSYDDIGIYFFVLVLLGAVIRIAVRIRWLGSSRYHSRIYCVQHSSRLGLSHACLQASPKSLLLFRLRSRWTDTRQIDPSQERAPGSRLRSRLPA